MLTGIAAGLAAGALWGLVFVAPRMLGNFSAVDFTAGRFLSFGAFSCVLMLTTRKAVWPDAAQTRAALCMSVLGFTGYYLLLVFAIRDAGTEVPSLIIGTIPIWMMLLGKPVGLKWKSLAPGMVLTGAGLALMMAANYKADSMLYSAATPAAGYWRGVAFAVAAMLCWTVFGLVNSAWLKRHAQVNATDWANWLGVATGVAALILWIAAGSEAKVLIALDNRAYLATICIVTGIGSAWLPTILWNIASQRLSASLCGQLIVSETVFALVYSYGWDGQWPTTLQVTACVLFILGILASIQAHA